MLTRLGFVVVGVLAGCSTETTEGPSNFCQGLQQIVLQPASPSDPLRVAYYFTSYAESISGLSNGSVIVPTCTDLATVDASGNESKPIATDQPHDITAAVNDEMYAVTSNGIDQDITAISPDGTVRWQSLLPDGSRVGVSRVVGSADGAYVETVTENSGPNIQLSLLFYDRATGMSHTVLADSIADQLVGPGPGGGLITQDVGMDSTTLHHLDATGTPLWTLTAPGQQAHLGVAAPTPDGGVIVSGAARPPIDLGSVVIPATGDGSFVSYLAGIDAHGVVRWGYRIDFAPNSIVVAANGDAILGGGVTGSLVVARARATGVVATRTMPFVASAWSYGAAPAGDGAVWLQVGLSDSELVPDRARLQVGDHVFTDSGHYLLQLGL